MSKLQFGTEGALILAKWLAKCKSLTELDVRQNLIRGNGAVSLSRVCARPLALTGVGRSGHFLGTVLCALLTRPLGVWPRWRSYLLCRVSRLRASSGKPCWPFIQVCMYRNTGR